MWIRCFSCLALIPIEKFKDAWEIIVNSISIEITETLVKFIKYFIDVWIKGKKGNDTISKLKDN
jgi:hypothetical protein